MLVVTAADGDVNSEASRAAGTEITEFVAGFEHVDIAVSYWTLQDAPPLRGSGGDRALVMAHVEGTDTEAIERADDLVDALEESGVGGDAVTIDAGGLAVVNAEVTRTIEEDLRLAEMIAIPITLVLLIWVFGIDRRRAAPAGGRHLLDHRHVRDPAGDLAVHRGVDLLAQRHDGAGSRASPSTTACSSSPATARSWRPATTSGSPSGARCGPPAGRSCSAPLTVGIGCPRCSCSRCRSCARSGTPESASPPPRRSVPWSCCPRCSPRSATASTRAACSSAARCRRRRHLASRRRVRDAPAGPRRHGRDRLAAVPRRAVPRHQARRPRRPGARRGLRRPGDAADPARRVHRGEAATVQVVVPEIGDPGARPIADIAAYAAAAVDDRRCRPGSTRSPARTPAAPRSPALAQASPRFAASDAGTWLSVVPASSRCRGRRGDRPRRPRHAGAVRRGARRRPAGGARRLQGRR